MKSICTTLGILAAILCVSLSSRPAAASEVTNTTVVKVGVGPYFDSLCGFKCMLIALASAPTGSSCAMDTGWHYAIDLSDAEARVSAAAALSAKASGYTVQANGNNTCIYNNRIERFSHLVML